MDMPSDNQSKAWARLSTLTSFVSWMCFARARCSDSENVNRLIAIPPTVDFTGDKMGSVKNIMSTYLRRPDRHCQRRLGRGAAPRSGVALFDGARAPLCAGGDESGGESGATGLCHPSAQPGAGDVPVRAGGAGLSDPMRPGGGPGRLDPGLCAALRAGL